MTEASDDPMRVDVPSDPPILNPDAAAALLRLVLNVAARRDGAESQCPLAPGEEKAS